MRLANDNFRLSLGKRSLTLRPSLRAALYLETKYEGLQNLCDAIIDGRNDACCDLIGAACTDQNSWIAYSVRGRPLSELMDARVQLLQFVRLLAGADSGAEQSAAEGEPITFEEYCTRLFQIGTGFLGWSPEQTWEATFAEIINAKIGRNELLASIFGSGKAEDTTIDIKDADGRAELNALGDLSVMSMSKVRQCV